MNIDAFFDRVIDLSNLIEKEGLALPPANKAEFIQEVLVPAGTRLERSRVLPANNKRGGMEQFKLIDPSSGLEISLYKG